MQRKKPGKKNKRVALPVLNPDAAGIDIGATEIYVAVAADRDAEPIRSFATFTQDLTYLADWLQQCGIRTVAMESTGVYWIPLMQILEARGLEVYLVNANFNLNGMDGVYPHGGLIFDAAGNLYGTTNAVPRKENNDKAHQGSS